MQKSHYTIIVPHQSKQDHFIAYNTRTQALVTIPRQVKDALEALPSEDRFQSEPDVLAILYDNGIVVKDNAEDAALIADFYDQIQERADATVFEITILTTFQCNFVCSYCFESNVSNGASMSMHTCDDTMSWVQYQIVRNNYRAIHVTFYGGEPLINKTAINRLVRQLKKICTILDVTFSFGMITNGYLLNEFDIDEWITQGMTSVRVTVDGDQETHDKRRMLRSGKGTFAKIMENIERIIDKDVKVSITGNYDRESFDGVIRLLDHLDARGLLPRFASIGFNPVLPRLGSERTTERVELTACLSKWATEYFDMTVTLREEMKKRALKVPIGIGYLSCQLMSRHNGVVIAPDGLLYKCPAMVGHTEFSVGNVLGIGYNDTLEKFLAIRPWEKCEQSCPYLPVCSGGCRFMAYVRDGHFKDVWCSRQNIDRLATELIQADCADGKK